MKKTISFLLGISITTSLFSEAALAKTREQNTAEFFYKNDTIVIDDTSSKKNMIKESAFVPVQPNTTYRVSAETLISYVQAQMKVTYYDNNGIPVLDKSITKPKASSKQWETIDVLLHAPKNASQIKIAFQSGKAKVSSATFKNIQLSEPFENVGPQITNLNVMKSATGTNSDGTPLLYTLLQGEPAKLVVLDLNTNRIYDEQSLTGSTAAWSIKVDPYGYVWMGGLPDESLYQYNPSRKSLLKLGKATTPTNTVIWDLEFAPSQNAVFGSTSYGGNVFRYIHGKGFTNLGQAAKRKELAKSLGYSPATETLFVGTGSNAALIAWDLQTNKKQNILPAEYHSQTTIYDIDVFEEIVFARLEPSEKMLLFNAITKEFLGEIPADSRGVSPKSPYEDAVYYGYDGSLYRFDLNTRQSQKLHSDLQGTHVVSLNYVQLNHPKYPGFTLVGTTGNDGRFFKYNLQTQRFELLKLNLPKQSVPLFNISKGPNGEIYSSGFVSGSLGVYDTLSNSTKVYSGLSQAESMEALGNFMYFGGYPKARIFKYDPSRTWNAGSNPTRLWELFDFGQNRPVSMLGVEEVQKLYIGTAPDNGKIGGAFTIFDPKTGIRQVRENLVPNQTIISMAYQNGYVYGGTSIYGGKNSRTYETSAKLFAVDVSKNYSQPAYIPLPLSNIKMISSVVIDNNQKLWGMADGYLFIYSFGREKTKVIPIVKSTSGYFKNATLLFANDGYLYGTVEKTFFKVNPETYKLDILRSNNDIDDLVEGKDGNLYFKNGTDLWRYSITNP
ncbi:hypothetical protein IHV12_04115 [Fictibacillus sp. 7GRE50]|uniref:hypothetical protein n=1 Tax=Fictibacillus sp. 7GRE50 TaxID=2745878 RepID=UPI0018CCE7A6|nr:hypothetical protein [Fictibacillus sp. 7GRE50]MBH0164085.1 hypothetical protein [Fictibacillus sp. 7GRE50]